MSTTSDIDDITSDDTTPNIASTDYYVEEEEILIEEEEEIVLQSEDFISGPFRSDTCTVPDNILEFDYSYGYDCKRYYNLVCPDENTLVFASGNLLHFYDINTEKLWFRRSYLGGGIGHLTFNPNKDYPHLAVAENGDNPPIILYHWPSMDIVGILKDGAAKRYAHINYSPDGDFLVSQSYAPDFLITVFFWKQWRRSPIILRTKSHVHDVYRVMFSPYVPGHISSGGAGHIKFWRMSVTFTGLKLQGELGRFGKTEISDVVALYPMPDEKVISGSEWGNILVWEAGLIKVEVFRTKRRRCHNAPIMQFEYDSVKGEIWSIAMDGWLRSWFYKTIDEADPPEEDRIVQMVPSYERQTPGVEFMCVVKKLPHDRDDTLYYAQDGNGGIWLIDLILKADYQNSQRIRYYHAGPVVEMAACPWDNFIISLGDDGRIMIYDYIERRLMHIHQFPAKGRAFIWAPLALEPSGKFLILGFDDGVVRVCVVNFEHMKHITEVITVQSIKPHSKPVTTISLNPTNNVLVTGGEDKTIFIFMVKRTDKIGVELRPIGFVPIETIVTYFMWHPQSDTTLLAGCMFGEIFELKVPINPLPYTKISFLLHTLKPIRQRFVTCKAQIRRDIHIKEIEEKKLAKVERKKIEIAQLKQENPGLEIDEEIYLLDLEEEEKLEPLHIPEIPNRIWFMMFTPENTLWLSMGGYDAGYIYEYTMDQLQDEALTATIIEDGDDIEMHGYLKSPDEKYLITSMQNGAIRFNTINTDNFRDLSDYWLLNMHDNFNGRITKMCFSYDYKYFFSSGTDGNIFSYKYNLEDDTLLEVNVPKIKPLPRHIQDVIEDLGYKSLSLEEMMIKAEEDKQMRLANEHKRKLRARLEEIRNYLTTLLIRNCALPKSQRFRLKEFIIDPRIMKAFDDTLQAKVALERRKLAYDVEKSTIALQKIKKCYLDVLDCFPLTISSINLPDYVKTIPQRALRLKFFDTMDLAGKKLQEEILGRRVPERLQITADLKYEELKKTDELEKFLIGLSPSTISFKLGGKLTRMLRKYRERRVKRAKKQQEWDLLMSQKPHEGINHPDDEAAMEFARSNIGDFKLKCSPDYKVELFAQESTSNKYLQLLDARLRVYKDFVGIFNARVYEMREKKVTMIKRLTKLQKKLDAIHKEMPNNRILHGPPIPEILPSDFPEKDFESTLNIAESFQEFRKLEKTKQIMNEKDDGDNDNDEEKSDMTEEITTVSEMYVNIKKLPDIEGSVREIISVGLKDLSSLIKRNKIENAWEKEADIRKLINNIYDQEQIIEEMNALIAEYDEEIKTTNAESYRIRLNCTFMDLHLLMLNQELTIIGQFEGVENELKEVANKKLEEKFDMEDLMTRIELNIDARNQQIDLYNDRMKEIQQAFLAAAKDNKFFDFLRRIFKKKYRPPRIFAEGSESSSESESDTTSSEDDAGSLDSGDIGPLRLDESICPKGCDRDLYDYTFQLRSQRQGFERQIKEELEKIGIERKELETYAKKMKYYDLAAAKSQEELEKYQRLKQMRLNEVNTTVVLKLNQLQHLSPSSSKTTLISECLVFNNEILRKLYSRVNELQHETLEERARHKKNVTHYHRMGIDIKHMLQEVENLNEEIKETMIIKFGRKINIDDLEESVLKRAVTELRLSMLNLDKFYQRDIDNLRKIYGDKQMELRNVIRENTGRIDTYRILYKERAKLIEINASIEKQRHCGYNKITDTYYLKDIEQLENVVQTQQEQIQALKAEINILRIKSLPLQGAPTSLTQLNSPFQKSNVTAAENIDFGSLDDLFISDVKQIDIYNPYMDQMKVQITEDEIIACVKEVIEDIIKVICTKSNRLHTNEIITILSEIIEQIPIKYIQTNDSVAFIANLLREHIDAVSIERENISKQLAIITSQNLDVVRQIVENIFEIMFDDELEPVQDEQDIDEPVHDK